MFQVEREFFVKTSTCLWCALAIFAVVGCADDKVTEWNFEDGAKGWKTSEKDCGVVPEPGVPGNHVFQIVATKPHHTRMVLDGGGRVRNFILSARVKLLEWEGAPPGVYLYGRMGEGGFRALVITPSGTRAFCYYGQDTPAVEIGRPATRLPREAAWVNVALSCFDEYVFAKAWPVGSAEPAWQAEGCGPGLESGEVALGVWTSPRTPSKAKVLFDDVRLTALTAEDLERRGIKPGPRPRLDVAQIPASPGVFELRGRIGLASKTAAIAFDRETGEITNLVDVRTGRDFIARDFKEPLFRVRFSKPQEGKDLVTSSREFGKIEIRKIGAGGLAVTFDKHISLPVRVEVQAGLLDDRALRMNISIRNKSDWCAAGVGFPNMPAPASLGKDDGDDYLLFPWSGGAVLHAPGRRGYGSRSALYPGIAFAQFYALYDDTAGLYVAMRDPDGHCKRFQLRCTAGKFVEMALSHLFPELPGRDVSLPYDIVVRTFKGDWRDAADIYKAWAVKQPWCAKKLADREDVPQFLKEGSGVIIASVGNPVGRAKLLGENLEKLPDLMDAYREATGLKHMVFVPYGWENRGTWAGINYFPSVPSDDLWRRANAELKKRGHRTAFLTSGFWWVVKRQKTGNGAAFDDTADFERRKGMCITNPDGSIWLVDWYDRTKTFGSWRGLSAKLCHGSREARDTMKAIFLKVAGLGVPLVSFDQEIGGGQRTPCYSKTHGHPPGFGNWMWTGFRDLCAEILKEGKPIQPELGLFVENVSELAVPYMSTYWSRQFGEIGMGAPGARGVGLFSYLYHEYVTAIGAACVQGQGQRGTRADPLLRCRILANNLTRGLIPGPFMHDVPLEGFGVWNKVDEWRRTVSRAYCSFCRPYPHFPEYLLLGKTRRPIPLECEEVEVYYWRRDAKKGKPLRKNGPPVAKGILVLPAVTTGSFEAADGSVAAFIVNATPEAREAAAVLPRGKEAVVYTAERKELKRASGRVTLSLEPFGVRVLVMK